MIGEPNDHRAFMDRVCEEVLDETLEEIAGDDARRDDTVSIEANRLEKEMLIHALTLAENEYADNDDLISSMVAHDLRERVFDQDEELRERMEEVWEQAQKHPLQQVMQQGDVGGTFMGP